MNTPIDASQSKNNALLKTYCSPQLIEYGNIQQLTNNVGMTSPIGDGGKGNNKTM